MNFAPLLCAILFSAPHDGKVDFDTQIVPILTKAGCNAGACHGAAAGRGGFNLSLLGGNSEADYESIVQQYEGRRVNLVRPSQSLLLAKPTGYVDHGGDLLFDAESSEARRLREWIVSGAKRGKSRKLTRFELTPRRAVVELGAAPIPLRAMASFDDGPMEDVTRDVLFTSTDTSAIEIDQIGPTARIRRSGQLIVIARYLDRVVPIEFLVPFATDAKLLEYPATTNFIDEEIVGVLKTLRIPRSPAASDSVFLRRVTLDLTGRLPSVELAQSYPEDLAPDKREKLVDSLLASEEFNEYWTYRFARALQLHSLPNDKIGVATYANWLKEQIRERTPLNEVASTLLTATGDSHAVGPANFARMVGDPRAHAELVGKVFMGVRLGCANCHNHPLDRWTQDDFHGFAAVFAKLDRGPEVKLTNFGAVTNLRTGEPAIPRIAGQRYINGSDDPRIEAAKALTDSEDRQFARAFVNRLWQAMMGRGLVEPIDDMRETNPPSHPQLLTKLANDFADHGYDLRRTLKLIVLSQTYALSTSTTPQNAADDRFYSHAFSKPLMPEILADAVADVTGVMNEFGEKVIPARGVTLIDPLQPAPSLDILGRCNRTNDCDSREAGANGLAGQLHLLNGPFLNEKLTGETNRLKQMLALKKSDSQIVKAFYLRAFSRTPTLVEQEKWESKLASKDESDCRERLEDFVWAILSSREFMENH